MHREIASITSGTIHYIIKLSLKYIMIDADDSVERAIDINCRGTWHYMTNAPVQSKFW